MAWFYIDGEFAASKEVLRIPPTRRAAAVGLWTLAGTWCAGQTDDGVVPDYVLDLFGGAAEYAEELVLVGLWHPVEGGWQFANWRKRSDGRYRANIPAAVRAEVMARDGYRCLFCGATEQLSLDHIIRYRDGGPDSVENLRVLCMPCNLERG